MNRPIAPVALLVLSCLASALGACSAASYCVPGGPADMSAFGLADARGQQTDYSIRQRLARQPLATFPTGIAVARVQDAGYQSYTTSAYGTGRYSVVTARDVEKDEDFERLSKLPMVVGFAPMSRLLLEPNLQSDEDLRRAAASLHADMLLIYTFDTRFQHDDFAPPLGLVTLGLFPTKDVEVRTTASAVLMDTRNGYVYAVAEGSGKSTRIANGWTSEAAADDARLKAEREAFEALVASFERAWGGVVKQHAARSNPSNPVASVQPAMMRSAPQALSPD